MKNQVLPKMSFFWGLTLILALGIKFYYRSAETSELWWILAPIQTLVEGLTGYVFIYVPDEGFFNQELNVIIDKSCAGLTFLTICLCLLNFSFLHYLKGFWWKSLGFLSFSLLSYLATLLINSFRIVNIIYIQGWLTQHSPLDSGMLHEMLGIFMYSFFLISLYLGMKYVVNYNYRPNYEKTI